MKVISGCLLLVLSAITGAIALELERQHKRWTGSVMGLAMGISFIAGQVLTS